MSFYPPSTLRLEAAVNALLDLVDCGPAQRVLRCQLVYRPTDPSYTVWAQAGIRPLVSNALSKALQRPFVVSDNHWELNLAEVEALLAPPNC